MKCSLWKKYNDKNNSMFRHFIWLTVIYLVANWFLIVLSGIWWDDWAYYVHDVEWLHEIMRQSSLPLEAYILRSVWWLPNGGYRIIVFFLFYFGSLLLYSTLRRTKIFTEEACFWISALYITIPINDARVTLICYGYSLGLFSFWLACYMVSVWVDKSGKQRIILRILSIIVLLFSFNTESIMLMTVIILFYLYYRSIQIRTDNWKNMKGMGRKCLLTILQNIDFLLAPIIFYFGKHLLFPAYGKYAGHNYVDWGTLWEIVVKTPYYLFVTLVHVLLNYKVEINRILVFFFIIFILGIFIASKRKYLYKKTVLCKEESYIEILILCILGLVVFFVGSFPYIVIRNRGLDTVSVGGRDSLLLGLGMALLWYYGIKLVLKKNIQKICYILIIILGSLHLNGWYINYQEDYYYQLQFEQEITENKEIQKGTNFLCMFKHPIVGERYYQLNGNAYVATGEMNRFFLVGIGDLQYLITANSGLLQGSNMDDYNMNDRILDGIIFINNEPIPNKTIFSLKINELFFKEKFYNWIDANRDIEYFAVNEEQSKAIITAYLEGILTETNLLSFVDHE